MALKKIFLHGYLKEHYAESYMLDVATPSEAVRALTVQLKGFAQDVRRGEFRVLRGKTAIDENELTAGFGRTTELHIVPVPVGSKNNGVLKVILGVVLIGVGFVIGAATAIGTGIFANITGGTLITMGAGMFLNGLGQLLSPTPEIDSNESADDRQSYIFGGCVNLTEEGNVIPLAYGNCWCGSLVLSAGMDVKEIQIGTTSDEDAEEKSATDLFSHIPFVGNNA